MTSRIDDDLIVTGRGSFGSISLPSSSVGDEQMNTDDPLERDKLAPTANMVHAVPLTAARVWDNFASLLPAAAANDDLGIYCGTLGTDSPAIKGGDLKAAGATTRYARFQIPLPAEYEDGGPVTLRVRADMQTTVADTSCTLDAEVYRPDGAGAVGSDLCATAAQSINSLTEANKDFTITPTTLVAGDVLDVRLAIACNDAATGTAVIPRILAVELLCQTRG